MKIKSFLLLMLFFNLNCIELISFKNIVLWGHKLHSHTHSYIHAALFRTFQHLGYKVLWLDNDDDISNIDFSNSLFITEGQVDEKIPLRNDCFYILHNCYSLKYKPLFASKKAITLQVYTHDCLQKNVTKMEEYIFYNLKDQIIYMPWATDLLPREINQIKNKIKLSEKNNEVYYVGTIGGGIFGNINQIEPFIKACKENFINFRHVIFKSLIENIGVIQNSIMAPAIQGEWQCEKGYIPCRIFKNISYGQFGITNSETVFKLFNKKIIYNSNTYQLFFDAYEKLKNLSLNELHDLMDFVRDNHTYINRINCLFKFLRLVNQDIK